MRKLLSAVLIFATTYTYAQCHVGPTAADDAVMIEDPATAPVLVDVLANDQAEGQALTVLVTGSTCPGSTSVDGFQLLRLNASPSSPITASCSVSYRVTDESGRFDIATVSVLYVATLFSDGFESGSMSAWSSQSP